MLTQLEQIVCLSCWSPGLSPFRSSVPAHPIRGRGADRHRRAGDPTVPDRDPPRSRDRRGGRFPWPMYACASPSRPQICVSSIRARITSNGRPGPTPGETTAWNSRDREADDHLHRRDEARLSQVGGDLDGRRRSEERRGRAGGGGGSFPEAQARTLFRPASSSTNRGSRSRGSRSPPMLAFGDRGSAGIERTASRPDGSFELFNYPAKPPAVRNATDQGCRLPHPSELHCS